MTNSISHQNNYALIPYTDFNILLKTKKMLILRTIVKIEESVKYLIILNYSYDFSVINNNFYDNLPNSLKFLYINKIRYPLKNLPFSLEKIVLNNHRIKIDDIRVPFGCSLVVKKYHDNKFVELTHNGINYISNYNDYDGDDIIMNYNLLRFLGNMGGLAYAA